MSAITSSALGWAIFSTIALLALPLTNAACSSSGSGASGSGAGSTDANAQSASAAAQKFAGAWSYDKDAKIIFECPGFGDSDSMAPPGDAGAPPDGGFGDADVVFTDAGTVRQTYVLWGKSTWDVTSDGHLRETTDDGCVWTFTVNGDVATLESGQSCDTVKDYSGITKDKQSVTMSETTITLSADGSTLTEAGKGLLHGVCTFHTEGLLTR